MLGAELARDALGVELLRGSEAGRHRGHAHGALTELGGGQRQYQCAVEAAE